MQRAIRYRGTTSIVGCSGHFYAGFLPTLSAVTGRPVAVYCESKRTLSVRRAAPGMYSAGPMLLPSTVRQLSLSRFPAYFFPIFAFFMVLKALYHKKTCKSRKRPIPASYENISSVLRNQTIP